MHRGRLPCSWCWASTFSFLIRVTAWVPSRKNVQVALRKRAGIRADSELEILAADHDMYVARCGGALTIKLGPRFDMPDDLVPKKDEGWELAASGKDWAVWAKKDKLAQ